MSPRPASPGMDSVCGRESSVSPPTVVAPVAVKPPPLSDAHAVAVPTDQQRLLYQLALAERLRLASAGLAWARPPLSIHHHHLQEAGMGGNFMGGLGMPMMGGLGSMALGGGLMGGASTQMPPASYPPPHPLYGYRLLDPRMLLPRGPEEPKPQHSYIGLIAMAILSSPDKKLILSDIYQYILDHYPYFRSRGTGWRNSIRHNLSLNDCFMKSGRSANGKGHYWAIHPANIDDFRRGDFRRRRAQRRVRKHLGLAVDDDSEPETLSPPPPALPSSNDTPTLELPAQDTSAPPVTSRTPNMDASLRLTRPKRQFDVLSLLAPDRPLPHHDDDDGDGLVDDHCMEISSAHIGGHRHQVSQEHHLHLGDDLRLKVTDEHRLQMGEDTRSKVTENHLQQVIKEEHLQVGEDQPLQIGSSQLQLGEHHPRPRPTPHLQVSTDQHLLSEANHHLQVSKSHLLQVAKDHHILHDLEDHCHKERQRLQVGEDHGSPSCVIKSEVTQPEGRSEEGHSGVGGQPSSPGCWAAGGWPRAAPTTTLHTPYITSDSSVDALSSKAPHFNMSPTTTGQQRPVVPLSITPSTTQPAHVLTTVSTPYPTHAHTSTSTHATHISLSVPLPKALDSGQ
ncbi:forkhead box protein J2-like [Homarus americanus]|uniref:Forkhead box protein I2-A-like n=1 Tax=Homarus americanus TaxID=6706 RepID=A0A8J5T258_HOMAM|nr:forkhead box protein J2-like [Homarus americanus]KAG7171930.1 Forkhead box protein I2-A-like [Homarus americanus]